MDRKALIGLLSGVTVVIAMLIGVGLLNARPAEGAVALRAVVHECTLGGKPAEGGYGLLPPTESCAQAF